MLELLDKIEILKKSLENHPTIRKLKKSQDEILEDRVLLEQIKNHENSVETEDKIKQFRSLENETNFLILEINQYLKENILKNSRCQNENN